MMIVRLWTALAALGLLISILLLSDALADSRWLRWSRLDGSRAVVARINLRGAVLGVAVQAGYTILGICNLVLPKRPLFVFLGLTARGWALVGILFLAEILIIVSAALDRRDRRRLLAKGQPHDTP